MLAQNDNSASNSSTWSGKKMKTLFYQGMLSSQTQLAKYCGTHGFVATTGETVRCARGIDVIMDPFVGMEIREVRLMNKTRWHNPLSKMQHYFSAYANWSYGIEVIPNHNSSETVVSHEVDLFQMSIGQQTDIENHYNKWKLLQDESEIILYGVSRGAATTFCSFCIHKYPNVKLVILEGCFDSIPHLLQSRYGTLGSSMHSLLTTALPNHKIEGPYPSNLVEEFPSGVPIAFITSEKDREVPLECTQQLAKELASKRTNPVYLLILKQSRHPSYMFDNEDDRKNYESFIHALYQQQGMAHREELALDGQPLLKQCLL